MGRKKMAEKPKWNFVIDAVMFILLMPLVGIGLLIKYILIPGIERWAVYGKNVQITLLGMDRHQWGYIHLIIGLCLIALFLLHLLLHLKWIVGMFRNGIKNTWLRFVVGILFVGICTILVVFPFLIKPEVKEINRGEGRGKIEQGRQLRDEQTSPNSGYKKQLR
jgi:hypothetical protein